jgi:hypothetical protein
MKYTKIFHCKTLQNLPKLGFLVWKQTIWQPCFKSANRAEYIIGPTRVPFQQEKEKTDLSKSSFLILSTKTFFLSSEYFFRTFSSLISMHKILAKILMENAVFNFTLLLTSFRVARWYIFKPNIQIWVYCGIFLNQISKFGYIWVYF